MVGAPGLCDCATVRERRRRPARRPCQLQHVQSARQNCMESGLSIEAPGRDRSTASSMYLTGVSARKVLAPTTIKPG